MPRPSKKASLFDDEDAGATTAAPATAAASSSSSSAPPAMRVNKRFATFYEDKKRKQDLARAREMGVFDADEYDSEDDVEEDEGDALTAKMDRQIMDTINLIRSRDPRVYNPEARFFAGAAATDASAGSDEGEATAVVAAAPPRRKPMARDVLAGPGDGL